MEVQLSNVKESPPTQESEGDAPPEFSSDSYDTGNETGVGSTATSSEKESSDESTDSDSSVEDVWAVKQSKKERKPVHRRTSTPVLSDTCYNMLYFFCTVPVIMCSIAALIYFKCDNHAPTRPAMKLDRVLDATYNFTNSNDFTKPFFAERVAVIQADPTECLVDEKHDEVVKEIKRKYKIVYNYVITADRELYTFLGWNRTSPMFPDVPTMAVAFLDRCDDESVNGGQIELLENLLLFSQDLGYLPLFYTMFGNKMKYLPISFHF